MTRIRKAKTPIIVRNLKTGLYYHLGKLRLDNRVAPVRAMNAAKHGLSKLFPNGVNAPAALLIDRIVFNALKLSIYEAMDIKGEVEIKPGSEQRYLSMANSLREDLRLLSALADKKAPEAAVPSLSEYLANLKSGKLQVAETQE